MRILFCCLALSIALAATGCVSVEGDGVPISTTSECDQVCDAISECFSGQCISDALIAVGQSCSSSSDCPNPLECCDGKCVNVFESTTHCNGCRNVCSLREVCSPEGCICFQEGTTCSEEQECGDNGYCNCLNGLEDCGTGVCDIDLATDAENCGACNEVCRENQRCLDGGCVRCDRADPDCDLGSRVYVRIDDASTGAAAAAIDAVVLVRPGDGPGYVEEVVEWVPLDGSSGPTDGVLGAPDAVDGYPDAISTCDPTFALALGGTGSTLIVALDRAEPGDVIQVVQLAQCTTPEGGLLGPVPIDVSIGATGELDGNWLALVTGEGPLVEASLLAIP